jgi:lysophospholipase L1-like esterase
MLSGASAVNELRTASVTNPVGLGTVPCTTTGPVTLLGVVLESDQPGVFVHRIANGGWGVNNYLQRDWTFDAQLTALAPDLVYIWLGQNDQGTPMAVYESKMSQLVDRVLADAPQTKVVLCGTYDAGTPSIPTLAQAMNNVAAARGLGFISVYYAAGTHDYLLGSDYLDGSHFSGAGGAYVGQLMYDAFVTDGADFCDTQIAQQPGSQSVPVSGVAGFSVVSGSWGSITYQWRRDGAPLTDDGRIAGAGTPHLSISEVETADAGAYDCVLTGPCGSATSAAAVLTVTALCPADFNRDGWVNGDDADSFAWAFDVGDQSADFDGNSWVNGDDADGFALAFEAGC